MSTQMECFLSQLAHALNFPALKADNHGGCLIVANDGLVPMLFELDDQLVPTTILLSAPIAAIPPNYRIDAYEAILIGNSSIEETLSIKPDEDILYLHRRLHPEIEADFLEPILTQFLATFQTWRTRIAEMTSHPPISRDKQGLPFIKIFPFKA